MSGLSGVDLQRVLIAGGNRTPMIFITHISTKEFARA
jgi:hypothetical protein